MKKLKFILVLLFFCSVNSMTAQQDPNFTLYNFNMNLINPAYAGSTETKEINLGHRSQWVGISEAPKTQLFSYTTPLKRKLGLAVSFVRDQVFVVQETDIAIDLSYNLKISETYNLFFGIKAGGSFINIDLNRAGAPEGDPLFDENQSFLNPQFGAGAYLKHADFYISISSPNLLNGNRYPKQEVTPGTPRAAIDNLNMYYGAGYHIRVNENVQITPAVMYRSTEGAPSSIDLNATVKHNQIEAGINYRIGEMYSIFTLFNVTDTIKLGAAYDFTISKLNEINDNGSIEILIKYQFKLRKDFCR
jgi:type IX secretion system PorP/SprF family membrane protein